MINPWSPTAAVQWHDRGYMPHVDGTALIQHVCYHLADSLPKEVVAAMAADLKSLPPKLRDAEKEARVAAYLDAGKGSCILRHPELAAMVQDVFLHFHGQRYHLHAWCVMPNHVHVLFQALPGWTMSKIVASWKSYTGRRISAFQTTGYAGLQSGRTATPEHGVPSGEPNRVWHREYWDRYIRDDGHYKNVVRYIHNNPVKAGLVKRSEDWRWSSAYVAGGGENSSTGLGGNTSAGLESGGPTRDGLEPGGPTREGEPT